MRRVIRPVASIDVLSSAFLSVSVGSDVQDDFESEKVSSLTIGNLRLFLSLWLVGCFNSAMSQSKPRDLASSRVRLDGS